MKEPISKEQALSEAFEVEAMLQTGGWKIMHEEITLRITQAIDALITEQDSLAVRDLQQKIAAYRMLISFPVTYVEAARLAAKEDSPSQDTAQS